MDGSLQAIWQRTDTDLKKVMAVPVWRSHYFFV